MATPELFDSTTRHSIYLTRYSSGVVNRLVALLNRAEPDLLAQLMAAIDSLPPESFTVARLELLLSSFRSLNARLYGQIQDALLGELREFSAYEAGFQVRMLQSSAAHAGIEASFASATAEQVYAAALSRPFQGVLLREALSGLEAATAKRVRDAIRIGYVEGEPIAAIVRRIKGTRAANYADGLLDWSRRDIGSVARTAVAHTANVARQETYEANDIKRWQFVATLDSKTTLTCASLSGKTFPVGKGPMPPRHYNCLPGNSLVLTRSLVTGAYERWFDGEVVVIKTAGGRELASTPNHPILTRGGWVASGALNVGDRVVCDGGSEWRGGCDGDHENVPARIEHVARSFLASGAVVAVPVPVAAEDFHGDGGGSKVAVVAADCLLRGGFDSALTEHCGESILVDGSAPVADPLVGRRGLAQAGLARDLAATGDMGEAGEALALLGGCPLHPGELLFGSVASVDVVFAQDRFDAFDREAGAIEDAANAYAGLEHSDDLALAEAGVMQVSDDGRFGDGPGRVAPVLGKDSGDHFVGDAMTPCDFARRQAAIERGDDGVGVEVVLHSSDHDAVALEQFRDGRDADAVLAADILGGSAGDVFLDDVVSVERIKFSGHVYNLETEAGWYCANGIVTHNCRSTSIPLLPGQTQLQGTRASVDYRGDRPVGRQVDANVSFSAWLRGQPASVQDEILGARRAKLFRDNKIEVDRFTDSRGNVYTLDELRRRDGALFGDDVRKAA